MPAYESVSLNSWDRFQEGWNICVNKPNMLTEHIRISFYVKM